jgi:hypothetical protein
MNLSHLPAQYFIKGTGIHKQTFFQRVALRDIDYIKPFRGDRLYSVKDWNKKCPDYKLKLDNINE